MSDHLVLQPEGVTALTALPGESWLQVVALVKNVEGH